MTELKPDESYLANTDLMEMKFSFCAQEYSYQNFSAIFEIVELNELAMSFETT